MNNLPKLPIGIQTFEKLREGGYLYVDKTKHLIDLVDHGGVYFLSRPRRFGKSLTISTFEALFSGRRDLFEGLYAEEFFSRPDYKARPVVHLDMSGVTNDMGVDVLRSSIISQLKQNADRLETSIDIDTVSPADALSALIENAAAKHGAPAAVLVDEYDKPILDHIHDPEKAGAIRELLRNFYVRIKAADRYVSFVFITGISKFSKMGIFSAMNNLKDISMKDEYATMLGYTESELLSNFDGYIDRTAAKLGESKETLISRVREYYDGFSFDGKNRLYNPFSTLNFFDDSKFRNYWFESGTPSYLAEYVKRHDLEAENFRGLQVSEDFTSVTEIEFAPPESFLFQSGYLSVRAMDDVALTLDYPNMEVLSAVSKLFLSGRFNMPPSGAVPLNMEKAVSSGDAEGMVKIYNSLLAALPYDLYEREEAKYERARKDTAIKTAVYAESFYHSLLFTLLWASRVNTIAENHSYWGRSDIEAEKNGRRYVIEIKAAEGPEAAKKAAAEAMKQIRQKGYADKYAPDGAILIAIAIDKEKRRVAEYNIHQGRAPGPVSPTGV